MNKATLLPEPKAQEVTLYFKEGGSDKVYQAKLEQKGEGYVVNFAFGRRGSSLNTGTKTSSSVEYEKALAIYNKLVSEKKAKGYTEGESGTPYQHTEKQNQVSGILPQLLNPIEESELDRLVNNPAWCMQMKVDGKRGLLRKQGQTVEGINRKGLIIGLASPIVKNALELAGDFILDGECIGDVLFVFDLLEHDGLDYRPLPYHVRYVALEKLLPEEKQVHIELLPTYYSSVNKAAMLQKLKNAKAEGVVFKQLDAPYTSGRPNQGGSQLKHKFYATGSFIVAGINQQRSISLKLDDKPGTCGNVTIPANQAIPPVGTVVEVRFLYAYKASGCLYQPVFLGVRDDLNPSACTASQLKYKASEEDEEA